MNNRLAKILAAIIARTFAEDISDKITVGAAWTPQVVVAYKLGNFVFFSIEAGAGTVVANTQYTVANIAAGYRPDKNIPFSGHSTNANFAPQGIVNAFVWTNGDITGRTNNAQGNFFFISGFYKIA